MTIKKQTGTPMAVIRGMVAAAVSNGMIKNDATARAEFEARATKDPTTAMRDVLTFRDGVNRAQAVAAAAARTQAAAVAAASRVATPATPPTGYPSFWTRAARRVAGGGAVGHQRATVTAAGGTSRSSLAGAHKRQQQSGVHAAGATTQLIAAQRQREATQVRTAQTARATTMYDQHNLISAAGDNAQRLRNAEQAELQRMARERSARLGG